MVKRTWPIGTFRHNEMGGSLGGMSPRCDCSSIHLQKIFFLKSIDVQVCFRNLRNLLEFESALFTVKPKKI